MKTMFIFLTMFFTFLQSLDLCLAEDTICKIGIVPACNTKSGATSNSQKFVTAFSIGLDGAFDLTRNNPNIGFLRGAGNNPILLGTYALGVNYPEFINSKVCEKPGEKYTRVNRAFLVRKNIKQVLYFSRDSNGRVEMKLYYANPLNPPDPNTSAPIASDSYIDGQGSYQAITRILNSIQACSNGMLVPKERQPNFDNYPIAAQTTNPQTNSIISDYAKDETARCHKMADDTARFNCISVLQERIKKLESASAVHPN